MSARIGSTVMKLRLCESTRVIYQGFTGKQATLNARDSIDYGTRVVGGVSPGKAGKHPTLGLPVFDTVREAKAQLDPQASAVFVPATLAAKAIEEAIEAEIPLIVSVAEGMPVHDCLRVQQMLKTQSASRLIGPNSPGILNPHFTCRVGLMPFREFMPGKIAIVSRSGTLCYETVGSTTKVRLGQSTVIGIGGDRLPGTTYVDALEFLAEDPKTEGIILIGEVGGKGELLACDYIKQTKLDERKHNPACNKLTLDPSWHISPGYAPVQDIRWVIQDSRDSNDEAIDKIKAFRKAGIKVLDHIGYIGEEMRTLLTEFTANRRNP